MAKTTTLRKRGLSWHGRPVILRQDADIRRHDPSITLKDPKITQAALLESVKDGDYAAIIDIYRAHLRVMNRTHAAKELHVSRQYVHRMLKSKNRPSLKTFAAFMEALDKRVRAKQGGAATLTS